MNENKFNGIDREDDWCSFQTLVAKNARPSPANGCEECGLLRGELYRESAALKVTQKLLSEALDEPAQTRTKGMDSMNNEQVLDKLVGALQTENARLKAELEALKPRPAVVERYVVAHFEDTWMTYESHPHPDYDNLKLTFINGVLTSAEVIAPK